MIAPRLGQVAKRVKRAARYVAITLISTGIVLVVGGEIVLQIVGYRGSGATYMADPLLGWSLQPGAAAWEVDEGDAWTRINSQGYRDRERTEQKAPDVYRVAVLGDSITEGRQVSMDRVFTFLAEAELNRRQCHGKRQVEVLNFGVPGYGTGQELLQLRERVWKFSPDLVVLQFYAANDLFNNHPAINISPAPAPYFALRNGRLELDESFLRGRRFNPAWIRLKSLAADLMNRSRLLQMVNKVRRVQAQRAEFDRLNNPGRTAGRTDPNIPPPNYQRFLSFLPPTIEPMVEAWQITEAILTEFQSEVESNQVRMLLMIVPSAHQIHPDPRERDAYRTRYGIESLSYADDRVEHYAHRLGVPTLRLDAPLLQEATRTATYMVGFPNTAPNEGHLNERGHAVVARELAQAICANAGANGTALHAK